MDSDLPRRVEKPWGYELITALTQDYAGKLIFMKKGHALSLQYHKKKDETLYLYEGEALVEIQDGDGCMVKSTARPGYCIRIKPLTRHRVRAIQDTTFFEVSTPELEDVERIEDDYGRA